MGHGQTGIRGRVRVVDGNGALEHADAVLVALASLAWQGLAAAEVVLVGLGFGGRTPNGLLLTRAQDAAAQRQHHAGGDLVLDREHVVEGTIEPL